MVTLLMGVLIVGFVVIITVLVIRLKTPSHSNAIPDQLFVKPDIATQLEMPHGYVIQSISTSQGKFFVATTNALEKEYILVFNGKTLKQETTIPVTRVMRE